MVIKEIAKEWVKENHNLMNDDEMFDPDNVARIIEMVIEDVISRGSDEFCIQRCGHKCGIEKCADCIEHMKLIEAMKQ